MTKYTLSQIANLLDVSCAENCPVAGVCADTRLLNKGELFFALPGGRADGHQFLAQAIAQGASAAVVSHAAQIPTLNIPLLHVDDPLKALQTLAKNLLAVNQPKIIGVTGSIGKTTTKDFITQLLKRRFHAASSPGNSNSQIGLPLAILNHTTGAEEILVLEMGMTHKGNILGLVDIAPPDVAVITTTTLVHSCNFNSLDEIGQAKAEIFSHPKTRIGILDRNIVNFDELKTVGHCNKISFALDTSSVDFTIFEKGHNLIVKAPDGEVELPPLPVLGKHNRHNFLAAVAAVRSVGVSWDDITSSVETLQLPERRLQVVEKNGVLFINDSYNACPLSLKAALDTLPKPKSGGKSIAVIGEMLELGKFSKQGHREVAEHAFDKIDFMLCYGQECGEIQRCWKEAKKPVEWFADRNGVAALLKQIAKPGDVVLLKGSRAMGAWKVLEEI
jgi:UDP-N-acetylmuramoyl-tripeptide--D-alanyl-D-alanine ligase